MLDGFSAEVLARVQFAFTVSFHIIFPAFSIGLASFLAVVNALWLWTKDETYRVLFDYWKKIFAVAFGMGVVSGIVMSYQFGTNWSVFSDKAGPVVGPLMAYEVLSAFFLEAGFLGIMLFGLKRVGPGLHMFATAMVAFGTLLSATWILSVNSWMQTPAGYGINDLLKDNQGPASRRMFSMAMWMLLLVTPLQFAAGDFHGINTLEHQPAKVMAMEGHFDSHPEGAPLILFGIPNQAEKRVDYAIEVPKLSSLILKHDLNAPLDGLDTIPDEDEPPVAIVFFSFRVMVGLGFAMLALGLWGGFARWRGKLHSSPMLHRAAIVMGPMGFVAVVAGWITTEVGRQPFTVYGLLRTSDSLAPVSAPAVGASLIAFIVVYFFVFGAGVFYILGLMRKRPHVGAKGEITDGPVRAAGTTTVAQDKSQDMAEQE